MELTQELGPMGEVPGWLVLGYLPIPPGADTWAKSLDNDLLASAGGEGAVRPVGGQTVTVGGQVLTWQRARALALDMTTLRAKSAWLPLFDGADGKPMENTAVYLFCRLVCPSPVEARLLLGSDDSVKVLLNGAVLHRFVGQRSVIEDDESVRLPLRAGANTLLVRVDNYVGNGGFVGRLVDAAGSPLRGVAVQLDAPAGTPDRPPPLVAARPWVDLVGEVPAVPAAPHEELFGTRLPRTMALLETGAQTRRPVRIVFLGQSITAQGWTQMLVQRLRERYPGTLIEAENVAIGGWTMPSLIKTIGHTVLRSRPDLVVFHVYSGTPDQWDRVLTTIRRETCAEILLRSAHPQVYNSAAHVQGLDDEELLLRAMAAKHECEFVECRREWADYLKVHGLEAEAFLADAIHLNRKGQVLMAQLYERHFRNTSAACVGWANRVRWYGARRPFEERRDDEIRLSAGWRDAWRWVESSSTNDTLTLTFTGNRVDVALAPGKASARVLIDGRPPSAFNLYHGGFPRQDTHARITPVLARYFTGTNATVETWALKVTEWSNDRRAFRFTLTGSVTGPDGVGEGGKDFVSQSGRIRFFANDLSPRVKPPAEQIGPDPAAMQPAPDDIVVTWPIVSDSRDEVHAVPAPPEANRDSPPATWITVADGLPYGRHELTLMPAGDGPIGIVGVEVGRPPLAE
jgi:hypothetical protein